MTHFLWVSAACSVNCKRTGFCPSRITCPRGREKFSPRGQRAPTQEPGIFCPGIPYPRQVLRSIVHGYGSTWYFGAGFWFWDILILSFLTSASTLLPRFSNPRGARAFGAILSHVDHGRRPQNRAPFLLFLPGISQEMVQNSRTVRRCGVISYAQSRQPYFRLCRSGDFGFVLRHKPTEHRIQDVSATPDVEVSRITSCRGSRVSLTFVHAAAVALLPTAASRVRTSLIFSLRLLQEHIRLRAFAYRCHTAKLADLPSCAKCPNPTRVSHLWCRVSFSDVPTTTHRSVWLDDHRLSLVPHPNWQGPGNIVERTPLPQEEILLFSCSFSWSVHCPIARRRSRSHGLP